MIPNAATLPRKPKMRPNPPRNSAQIARNANRAGMPDCWKLAIVAVNPGPPNQPSAFCAPCTKNTIPTTNLKTVKVGSLVVRIRRQNIKRPPLLMDVQLQRALYAWHVGEFPVVSRYKLPQPRND